VGISVGLAQLAEGETPVELTARADAVLIAVKKSRVH
jgi:PleD family two-component response regulator